jgi:hypothetical protein
MTMLCVDVLAGPPGCGKSEKMISEAAAEPARYLFALPTIDLIDEQVRRFRHAAPQARAVPIHSASGARGSVSRRIKELLTQFSPDDHVAAFITHEALMDFDFAGFSGWHARIDEPPNAITTGSVSLSQSVATFRDHFDLVPFEAGWSQLRPRQNASWKTFADDTMWRDLTDFRKLAQRPQGMLMQMENWSDAQRGQVAWFSLWTPLQLSRLSTVTIAGAGFLTSIGYRVMQATYGATLEFNVVKMGSARPAQPRIRISYFTRGHRGSTTFWGSSEGRECLVRIERWLADNVAYLGFWSGNEAVRHSFEHRLPGRMTAPKLAGLNCHREAQSCAFFYSSKALPQDETLKTIFELTPENILVAREDEDIFQFVLRGAVRDPGYGGDYDIYLYSVDQAERLRETLIQNGFADVEVIGIEGAGIMDFERKNARRTKPLMPMDQAARAEQKRKDNARRNRESRAKTKLREARADPPSTRGSGTIGVPTRISRM